MVTIEISQWRDTKCCSRIICIFSVLFISVYSSSFAIFHFWCCIFRKLRRNLRKRKNSFKHHLSGYYFTLYYCHFCVILDFIKYITRAFIGWLSCLYQKKTTHTRIKTWSIVSIYCNLNTREARETLLRVIFLVFVLPSLCCWRSAFFGEGMRLLPL